MFEFLNNTHFQLLSGACNLVLENIQNIAAQGQFRVSSVPSYIWQASSAILKFFGEFCSNFGGRINFDSNSVNGFLLFKLSSEILVAYGQVLCPLLDVLQGEGDENIDRVYKLIHQCILVLSNTICGTYVNFGVFSLYQDASWQQSFDAVLQMALQVPPEDLAAFVTLRRNFYNFIEHLAHSFPGQIAHLDADRLNALLQRVLLSIDSDDSAISTKCCSVVDKIVSYFIKLRHNVGLLQVFDQSAAETIRAATDGALGEAILAEITNTHQANTQVGEYTSFSESMAANMPTFDRILGTLFRRVLRTGSSSGIAGGQTCPNQYSVSRPMLSLIVLNPENFQLIAQRLVNAQHVAGDVSQGPNVSQVALDNAFRELMNGVLVDGGLDTGDPSASASIEPRNRDRFSQQLNGFVSTCLKYMVVNLDVE
jgi:exportin-7